MKTYKSFINELRSYRNEIFSFLTKSYDIEVAFSMIEKNPEKYLDKDGKPYTVSLEDISKYFSDGTIFTDADGRQYFNMGVRIKPQHAMSIPDEDLGEYGIWVVDGSFSFLIDGWHRAYRKWKNGETTFYVYVIDDPEDVKKILLT